MDRRSWMGGFAAAAMGGSMLPDTVTETTAGKVRGYRRNGIFTFKGIPYATAARFMPPTSPAPWSRVRSSLSYGPVSPQEPRREWTQDEQAFVFDWDDGLQREDCLRVNVWTPGLRDRGKRPVMVWLHGGGFSAGSAHELKAYDGENLARRGDVVVVSVNHRLGAVGFLNLAKIGGERYAASANAGILDLVAALEWVRDNIANFGGDAGNVTIFGQSGGGGKVNVLLSMPRAKGLFHKAIVQSGSALRMPEPATTAKLAAAVMKELGTDLAALEKIPFERLVAAGASAAKRVFPPIDFSRTIDFERFYQQTPWAPTVDGALLPAQPIERFAAHDIPLMVGSTLTEFAVGFDNPQFDELTDAQLLARMTRAHGKQRAPAVLEAFRRGHPGAKPADLFTIWFSSGVRRAAIRQAEVKAAQGNGPVYLYWFAWHTPVLDGRLRAFHCLELPFVFDNTDRCESMTGGGPEARALAARVSEAWIRFARTGDPGHRGLPKWVPYTTAKPTTMIFNNICEAKDDPDGAELQAVMEQIG